MPGPGKQQRNKTIPSFSQEVSVSQAWDADTKHSGESLRLGGGGQGRRNNSPTVTESMDQEPESGGGWGAEIACFVLLDFFF